jgi:hypothetical protein
MDSVLDTLHIICHKMFKDTIIYPDLSSALSFSRKPILSYQDTKGPSSIPIFDSISDDEGCLGSPAHFLMLAFTIYLLLSKVCTNIVHLNIIYYYVF